MDLPLCNETEPTHADIARALNQLHRCMDGVRGDVREIKADVAVLKDSQTTFDSRLTAMAKRIGVLPITKGETDTEGRKLKLSFLAWPGWKLAGMAFGALSGVVLAIQLFALPLAHFLAEAFGNIMASH